MGILVDYKLISSSETINLEDFGHDEFTKWADLSEEQQHEITDNLLQQIKDENRVIVTSVREYKYYERKN